MTDVSKNSPPSPDGVGGSDPRSPRGGAPAQERELRAQGRKTITKLMNAAAKAFAQRGYHATRVDDIVKLAKTSHGTFYLYYSNKDDLLRALIHDCAEDMAALASSMPAIGPDEEGYEALREWLGSYTELYLRYGPVMRAWTEAAEMPGSEFSRLGKDVLGTFSHALAERIGETGAAKVVDPELAALAFVAMIDRLNGLLATRQVKADPDDLLDTVATITHAGLFGGPRQPRRLAALPRA